MSWSVSPELIPRTMEEVREHREDAGLIRKCVLGLPPGFDFFYFCTVVMGFSDLDPFVHGTLCEFLIHPKYGRFRDVTIPRAWFKTSVCTVGASVFLSVKNPDVKILIAMNTADNAEKRVNTIREHWMTNETLKKAFPEFVPDTKKVRWNNSCAEIKRPGKFDEGTYESIGAGGAVISRHYDLIIEDDLVYPKKDDLTGVECFPSQDDIDKAIGWHKLTGSLFSDPGKSCLWNVGTRWAVHDLKDYIFRNDKRFKRFALSAEKLDKEGNPTGEPVWESRFGKSVLVELKESQGAILYATQYLNLPRDSSEQLIQEAWLGWYDGDEIVPKPANCTTYVDLAGWEDDGCDSVILTVARDARNHLWVKRYDAKRFNPSEVIEMMELHAKLFGSKVRVEEVQYQKAIRFFAKKRMEDTGFVYDLSALPRDNRSGAKDLRIKTIEPVAKAGMLHLKRGMGKLRDQLLEYSGRRTGGKVDVIDVLGYETQLRLTERPLVSEEKKRVNEFSFEAIIEELEGKNKGGQYPFSLQCEKSEE